MSKEIRRFAITHSPLSSAVWTGLDLHTAFERKIKKNIFFLKKIAEIFAQSIF